MVVAILLQMRILFALVAILSPIQFAGAATYEATTVTFSGATGLTGELGVLHVNTEGMPAQNAHGSAKSLTVAWQYYDQANAFDLASYGNGSTSSGQAHHSNINIDLAPTRPDSSLFVVAEPRAAVLRAQPSHGEFSLPSAACEPQPVYFAGQDDLGCVPIEGQVQASGFPERTLVTLSGDFAVRLWNWNVSVHEANRAAPYWSGEEKTPMAPGGPPGLDWARSQALIVTFEEANLTVSLAWDDLRRLTLHNVLLDSSGTLVLGTAGDAQQTRGAANATISGGESNLIVTLADQQGTSVEPISTPLEEPRAKQTQGTRDAPAPLALIMFGLVVFGGAGWLAIHFTPKSRLLRALDGPPSAALATHAARVHGRTPENVALRVVAFLKAGLADRAEQTLEHGRLRGVTLPPADEAFLMATLRARQGRIPEAKQHAERCVRLDSTYGRELRAHGLLRAAPLVPLDSGVEFQ